MKKAGIFVFLGCYLLAFPLGGWCADLKPIHIPAKGEAGWKVTPGPPSGGPAPAGYEGRTDGESETAISVPPETEGKAIKARFTLDNKIKTCPLADGTAEGDGVFFFS
ncbi:MAG TPA: hypothetical protein VGF08_09260, partial [Terriglobales bacterium]